MYKIEKRPSGYILTFSGVINKEEMQHWYNESQTTLMIETSTSFGVIVDLKDMQPLMPDAKTLMVDGQKLYKAKGMKKSAVILNSAEICLQFKNLAVLLGIYTNERYIDASSEIKPIEKAIDWVKNGIDPYIYSF